MSVDLDSNRYIRPARREGSLDAMQHKSALPRASTSLIMNHHFKVLLQYYYQKAIGNCCFVLLANRASPQISDIRPDMRQRALFVTCRAAWRWNKMLLAWENVDSPLAAMVVSTEHIAL